MGRTVHIPPTDIGCAHLKKTMKREYYKIRDQYHNKVMDRTCYNGKLYRKKTVLDSKRLFTENGMVQFSKSLVLRIDDKPINLADLFEIVNIKKDDKYIYFGGLYLKEGR